MPTQPPPSAQDDGAHSLRSTARSLIAAGTIFLLITVVMGDVLLAELRSSAHAGLMCLAWALPAAGLIACGVGLKHHQHWACAVGRILAAVYVLIAIAAEAVCGLFGVVQKPFDAIVGAIFFALIAYAFALLPPKLRRANQYIDSKRRGFELVMKPAPSPPKHE